MRRFSREVFLVRDNVWVVIRIRDSISIDEEKPRLEYIINISKTQFRILSRQITIQSVEETIIFKSLIFDCVLIISTFNFEIFKKVESLTQAILNECNLYIITDGQSGSKKFYIIVNGPNVIAIFAAISIFIELYNFTRLNYKYLVTCSIVEIYKKQSRDLLENKAI